MRRRSLFVLTVLTVLAAAASCGDHAATPAPRDVRAPAATSVPPSGVPPAAAASTAWALVDITAAAGIAPASPPAAAAAVPMFIPEVKSLGVALFDYDNDGKLDLIATAGSTVARLSGGSPGFPTRLWHNETTPGGPIHFRETTAEAHVATKGWLNAPVVADIDGDGAADVLLTGFGGSEVLRNRGDGTFEDFTTASGLRGTGWATGAAFADLDLDGDLDVYVAHYITFDVAHPPRHGPGMTCVWKGRIVLCGPRGLVAEADHAFRNDGAGHFTDATAAWGFDRVPPAYGLGVIAADFNNDGRPDIFVANDSSPNFLFENATAGFRERGLESGVAYGEDGSEMAGMGVDVADINGDGIPDIITTNFSDQPNTLFVSQGPWRWLESSRQAGLALATLPDVGWGTAFVDLDNDGAYDLFFANGHVYSAADEQGTDTSYAQRSRVFLNNGAGRFMDATERLGSGLATRHVARAAAFGDLNGDGAVDIVMACVGEPPVVLENRHAPPHGWLSLKLTQPGTKNPEAIGAVVTAVAGGRTQTREVRRNGSFQASNDVRVHFGLGDARDAVAVMVRWPDGKTESFGPIAPRARVDLVRGQGAR